MILVKRLALGRFISNLKLQISKEKLCVMGQAVPAKAIVEQTNTVTVPRHATCSKF